MRLSLATETPILAPMPTLGPTAAGTADADHAALHTTAPGVPNEHVSRLRQWFCSRASTTITPTAERYGKQTTCCIGSTERPQRVPARAFTWMTIWAMITPLTNWPNAMDFHAGMTCQAAVPALAGCALDRTLRSSTRDPKSPRHGGQTKLS